MELYPHLKTIISIILGLALGRILNGTVKFIQHPGRTRLYAVHLLWSLYLFILMVHFWWWEYRFHNVTDWTFTRYFFIIFYAILFFVICCLQYPDDVHDYQKDYRLYYYSRKNWFFSMFLLILLVDCADTWLKGADYVQNLMPEYGIKLMTHTLLCIACIVSRKAWVHWLTVLYFIAFELYFIVSRYYSVAWE